MDLTQLSVEQREEVARVALRRYNANESLCSIAQEIGISHMSLYRMLREIDWKPRRTHRGSPEKAQRNQDIIRKYIESKGKLSAEDIAKETGVTRQRVYQIIKRHFDRHPEEASRNPNRKPLSPERESTAQSSLESA